MNGILERIFGVKDKMTSVGSVDFNWSAAWAAGRTALVLFLCIAAIIAAIAYYRRYQQTDRRRLQRVAAALRAIGLATLVVVLAQPTLQVQLVQRLRPQLLMLFDGSDSMNLPVTGTEEDGSSSDSAALADSEGDAGGTSSSVSDSGTDSTRPSSRLGNLQAVLDQSSEALNELASRCRLKAYVIKDDGELSELSVADDDLPDSESIDYGPRWAAQLQADSEVTAIGSAIEEIGYRHRGRMLAGLVVVSDFCENSGPPATALCDRIGAPVFTVGVGDREAIDASISVHSDLVIKKDEQRYVTVEVKQTGLTGSVALVQLYARRLGGLAGREDDDAMAMPIDRPYSVILADHPSSVQIPYRPTESGRFQLEARIDLLEGEIIEENNIASREVIVRDEAIKLLFVENQPTYEWRFVKEVFYRDRLVGREGFRTYLDSADADVARSSDTFLRILSPTRSEFFARDVVFISDVPPQLLTDSFQEMLVEYVSEFGGGLVVIAGPHDSARTLAGTRLAEMLPVVVSPSSRPRVGNFSPQLTPAAAHEDFMQLADRDQSNEEAWQALGRLPWYLPVERMHHQSIPLLVHPVDRCADGRSPQPIIAMRRYGKGQVVYLGMNEMWRLRRYYGETYYRRFWGQLMYRLGLSHALGSQKRFQLSTDRDTYRVGDEVRITVEAYSEDFRPLKMTELTGRMISHGQDGREETTEFTLPVGPVDTIFEASSARGTGRTNGRKISRASRFRLAPRFDSHRATGSDHIQIHPALEHLADCHSRPGDSARRVDGKEIRGPIMNDLSTLSSRLQRLRLVRVALAWIGVCRPC